MVSFSTEAHPTGMLTIAYPPDGTRLVVDPQVPRRAQVLVARVGAPFGAHPVLDVDGVPIAVDGSLARWTITPGRHLLVARCPGLEPSSPVHIRVD